MKCVVSITRKNGRSTVYPALDLFVVYQLIMKAYRQRLDAEAWNESDREHIVGECFKRDGKWTWWCETELMYLNPQKPKGEK